MHDASDVQLTARSDEKDIPSGVAMSCTVAKLSPDDAKIALFQELANTRVPTATQLVWKHDTADSKLFAKLG